MKDCNKIIYETRSEADKAINELAKIPSTSRYKIGVKPHRSYRCGECKGWHITSMSKNFYSKVNTEEKRQSYNAVAKEKRQHRKINNEASYWLKKLGIEQDY